MASVFIMTDPPSDIGYSLVDNRVRSFDLRGRLLYDEDQSISVDGWEADLVKLVKEVGLDIDRGTGLHAFVYGLIDKGLLST